MAYLKYDTQMIETVRAKYNSCASEMESLQSEMQTMADSVRDAWRSEGGDAFFEKYSNEWLAAFTQYTEVLLHMADNLGIASARYEEITTEANKLSIR